MNSQNTDQIVFIEPEAAETLLTSLLNATEPASEPPANEDAGDATDDLRQRQQRLIQECAALQVKFVATRIAAERAYGQNLIFSAQRDEAWQRYREQNAAANELQAQLECAMKRRQALFEQIRNTKP